MALIKRKRNWDGRTGEYWKIETVEVAPDGSSAEGTIVLHENQQARLNGDPPFNAERYRIPWSASPSPGQDPRLAAYVRLKRPTPTEAKNDDGTIRTVELNPWAGAEDDV